MAQRLPRLVKILAVVDHLHNLWGSYWESKNIHQSGLPQDLHSEWHPEGAKLRLHQAVAKSRQATDPRDVVYEYLGLFPQLLQPGDKPDYVGETAGSLHAKVTKQCIVVSDGLAQYIVNVATLFSFPCDTMQLQYIPPFEAS